ncbi:hypothetical protein HAX54_041245 [Datura stramonium]|uniref:Secreted protein n=1 Tax=Datura stramonium TaxID=4076 RepID=A0ABS8SM52_DATST|nr:hypothetical protein [Datura stramonium]
MKKFGQSVGWGSWSAQLGVCICLVKWSKHVSSLEIVGLGNGIGKGVGHGTEPIMPLARRDTALGRSIPGRLHLLARMAWADTPLALRLAGVAEIVSCRRAAHPRQASSAHAMCVTRCPSCNLLSWHAAVAPWHIHVFFKSLS